MDPTPAKHKRYINSVKKQSRLVIGKGRNDPRAELVYASAKIQWREAIRYYQGVGPIVLQSNTAFAIF